MLRGPVAGLAAILLMLIGVTVVNYVAVLEARLAWLITMGILVVFLVFLGLAISGRVFGVLVDDRNKYSLSRLQLVIWTVIVLSAFITLGLARLRLNIQPALAIGVPEELWIAIGITATAFAGSPLIRAAKAGTNRPPNGDQTRRTLRQLGENVPDTADLGSRTRGLIVVNEGPGEADWRDLFRGEEVGDAANVDVGKIQMFFFTFLVVLAYSLAIFALLGSSSPAAEFPEFPSTLVTILALANGTYLVNKAVPHS